MATHLTSEQFLQKMREADSYQIMDNPETGQSTLITQTRRGNSLAVREEQFYGPEQLTMSSEEFMAFHVQIWRIMNLSRDPEEVRVIYEGDYLAEPEPDAASELRRKEASEREYSERWRRNGEDADGPSLLRDARALGEIVRHHDGEETG